MAGENAAGTQKETQVEFTGKAGEYFGIWIVNLLLSLLTLGIYSAWAKVRRKKYFHHNTLIDDVGFDYHAKPTAILKGRVIAVILFLFYIYSPQIHIFLQPALTLILFLALPWLVVRTSVFNARNTSHRGLRFDFVGRVGEAARVFILLPIATIFSLQLALPYADHQKNKFLMNSHKFGLSQFDMQATVKSFYKVYLIVLIPVIIAVIGILAAVAIPAYKGYVEKAKEAEKNIPHVAGLVSIQTDKPIVLAANEVEQKVERIERVYSESASEDGHLPSEAAPQEKVLGRDISIEELEALSDEELNKVLSAAVQEKMEADEQVARKSLPDIFKNGGVMGVLAGIGLMLVYALFIFGSLGYFKARIGNLVWNNTTIDKLSFKSSLRARDFIWIYFTNFVAIVVTVGLATPWAHVRLARYRASKLMIVGDVDFDQFVGDKKEAVKATGEEIADFFDIDLSFG